MLASIIESSNLDLIVHPTINCIIDIKWKKFGRIRAWIDLLLTAIYVAVWVTFGVWVPYNDRHKYDFTESADRFRLCLFVSTICNYKWILISMVAFRMILINISNISVR